MLESNFYLLLPILPAQLFDSYGPDLVLQLPLVHYGSLSNDN
jgi:hypothetical protein